MPTELMPKAIRRDLGKDFRKLTVVTDPETVEWCHKMRKRYGNMTMANFLDQILQRAKLKENPLA